MKEILLSDAVALTGKNESTLRRYFNKPENKKYRQIRSGKLFFSKDALLKKYPAIKAPESPVQTPDLHEETPPKNARTPELVGVDAYTKVLAAKDETIKSLQEAYDLAKEQLARKDEQLQLQASSYEHISREHNRIVHDFQNILKQLPERVAEQEQVKMVEGGKGWKVAAIVALALAVICAVAFGVALMNGWRFTR